MACRVWICMECDHVKTRDFQVLLASIKDCWRRGIELLFLTV